MISLRLALLFAATRHSASFTPARIAPSFSRFSNSALFSSDNDFDGFSSKVSGFVELIGFLFTKRDMKYDNNRTKVIKFDYFLFLLK